MSDELQRDQHSTRRHKTEVKAKRQAAIAKTHGIDVKSPHKYAKTHALTCGNANCVMCGNPRKFFGERTIQEKRFYQQDQEECGQDGNAADC